MGEFYDHRSCLNQAIDRIPDRLRGCLRGGTLVEPHFLGVPRYSFAHPRPLHAHPGGDHRVLLFLPGILIYLILRPSRTLEEEYQRTLEEEALLQTVEDAPVCPGCNRRVQLDWVACPNCHTRLKKVCDHCGKMIELPWNLCPYCGTPVAGMRGEPATADDELIPFDRDFGTHP